MATRPTHVFLNRLSWITSSVLQKTWLNCLMTLAVSFSCFWQKLDMDRPLLLSPRKSDRGKCTCRKCIVIKLIFSRVEPIIYRQLFFFDVARRLPATALKLYYTMRDPSTSKPQEYLAFHVKTIFIDVNQFATERVLAVIKACQNVETLLLWSCLGRPFANLFLRCPSSATSRIAPARLSLTCIHALRHEDRHFSLPFFRNVTHIEFIRMSFEGQDRWRFDTLQDLPHLTHVSTHIEFWRPGQLVKVVERIIRCCRPTLRVFIAWAYCSNPNSSLSDLHLADIMAIYTGDVDPRAVVGFTQLASHEGLTPQFLEYAMIRRSQRQIVREWDGRSAGRDFWTEAEERIEERKRQIPSIKA